MKPLLILAAFVSAFIINAALLTDGEVVLKSYAVEPPTVSERRRAASPYGKKDVLEPKHCGYGADPVTGECYHPKEGQFYRDPKTGKLKKKKVTKYNWPWK